MPPLTFEEPPGTKTGPSAPVLPREDVDALIANTGQWARTHESKTRSTVANRATRIREGRGNCAGHRWETAIRKIDGTTYALYVRHIAPMEQ